MKTARAVSAFFLALCIIAVVGLAGMDKPMLHEFMQMGRLAFYATLLNAFYAVLAVVGSAGAFFLADKYVIKDIDTLKELRAGNLAVAVVAAAAMLSVALILGMTLR